MVDLGQVVKDATNQTVSDFVKYKDEYLIKIFGSKETLMEFKDQIIIEEYPMVVDSHYEHEHPNDVIITVKRPFRVRFKTDEEFQNDRRTQEESLGGSGGIHSLGLQPPEYREAGFDSGL